MTPVLSIEQALSKAAQQWRAESLQERNEARQLVQQVLRTAPDHPGALNLAGCLALEQGQAAVALALFEKGVARAPNDAGLQGNLARSEFVLGRVEAARRRAEYMASTVPQAAGLRQEIETNLLHNQRPAAIAGRFFVADPLELQQQVDQYLSAGQQANTRQPKVLIAPHAGHVYSGATAGKAYALLRPFAQTIRRVVLLGPAHRVYCQGIALPGVGAYASPLGPVKIDTLGADAIADMPFVVTRPDVHEPEHSLEVHLPFLQRVLPAFELLPLVVGDVAPAQVAQVIERLWGGPETLIVISTDLSHYHSYEEANQIDSASCAAVLALQDGLGPKQACGATPLNAMLQFAKAHELEIEQIERCNSGDTAGSRDRVVGYASFALYEKPVAALPGELTASQGQALLQLARSALHEATGASARASPDVHDLQFQGAAFVTLTQQGRLRGCIGSLNAHRPLAEDVRINAASAALRDPRFQPVSAQEAENLHVEVSVLTPPEPMSFANESHALWQLQPGIDGLIFECEHAGRSYRSTYLPQVWEQIPSPRAFLGHLKVKAGLPFDFWSPQVRLSRYRAQKFKEQGA